MSRRVWALVVTAGVVIAILGPVAWPHGRDSFPLTPYPMFADRRPDSSISLVLAVGDTSSGPVVLPTEAIGHDQLTQAVAALDRAVAAGGDRSGRLCDEIAVWVSESAIVSVGRVRLVTASFDGIGYLVRDERKPTVTAEHARCEVAR